MQRKLADNEGARLVSDFRSRPARTGLYVISCLSVGLGVLFFSEIYSDTYSVIPATYFVNLLIVMGIIFKWKASVDVGSSITSSVLLNRAMDYQILCLLSAFGIRGALCFVKYPDKTW